MNIIQIVLYIFIGLAAGVVIGRFLLRSLFRNQEINAQNKAKKILKDAETNAEILRKDKLLEAREKFLQMKADHEQEINSKNNTINQRENSIKQKEQSLNQKIDNLTRKEDELTNVKANLEKQIELAKKKQEDIDVLKGQHIQKMESIAGLSAEDAKNQLIDSLN
jgi:ribonuclease Y